MKPTAIIRLLVEAFRHGLKVLLVSSPGVGKTSMVRTAATLVGADTVTIDFDPTKAEADAGAPLVLMHPAVSDPTDFKGLPATIKRGSSTLAEFLPFGNLRKLIDAKEPTICFIDDIGQAPHAVQAALMQLLQEREIDGQKISPHVVFVGATNDASHMAGVTSILEPVKSRWDAIIEVLVDVDDWIQWALSSGSIDPRVIAFHRFRPELLNDFKATRELRNSPCPRTVESVSKWLKAGIEDFPVIAGAAGQGYATEITAFLEVWRSIPDLDHVIAHPATAALPDMAKPSTVVAVASALSFKATKDNFENISVYLKRLGAEYEFFAMRDATSRDRNLASTGTYTRWALANQQAFAA